MSGFWQGALCLYLMIGGLSAAVVVPVAYDRVRSVRRTVRSAPFIVATLFYVAFWIFPTLTMFWRRRS